MVDKCNIHSSAACRGVRPARRRSIQALMSALLAGVSSWAAAGPSAPLRSPSIDPVPYPARVILAAAGKSYHKADNDKADNDDGDDNDDDNHFPQPVHAGFLVGRTVIAAVEAQNILGDIKAIVRNGDGDLMVVMTYGGVLGLGGHLVCVSLDDLALTGKSIQATGISPKELAALPSCDGSKDKPVDASEIIKVNLAKPAH